MISLKQLKRNFLIRIMTALGFGGMVAFCIASCQPAKTDQDKPTQDKPSETVNQDKVNQDKQPEPETVNQDEQQKDESASEKPAEQTDIPKDTGDEANKDSDTLETDDAEPAKPIDSIEPQYAPHKYGGYRFDEKSITTIFEENPSHNNSSKPTKAPTRYGVRRNNNIIY